MILYREYSLSRLQVPGAELKWPDRALPQGTLPFANILHTCLFHCSLSISVLQSSQLYIVDLISSLFFPWTRISRTRRLYKHKPIHVENVFKMKYCDDTCPYAMHKHKIIGNKRAAHKAEYKLLKAQGCRQTNCA